MINMNPSASPSSFDNIKAVILDLDGTVYEGNRLIDGADSAIEFMRRKGLKVIFCSNNSSRPAADIAKKLNSMGIPCTEEDVISSGSLAVRYAIDNHLEKVYFCLRDNAPAVEVDPEIAVRARRAIDQMLEWS